MFEDSYSKAIQKIERNHKDIGVSFPQAVCDGSYNKEEVWSWTSGFWGGLVNLAYRETGNVNLLKLACDIETALDQNFDEFFMKMHHDVGFIYSPTAVVQHSRDQNEKSLCRGVKAASTLASRFNIKGNYIRAWNQVRDSHSDGEVIIDSMMNLSILYWASKVMDDPRFRHIAYAHAKTVSKYFVRADKSVPHIICFDAEDGTYLGVNKGQGASVDSTWSRGQAWAIYGFAISYRETGDKEFLDQSKMIARAYMNALPTEGIPYWDFDASPENRWAFDSSSACIASSGLLEIYTLTGEREFKEFALRLLRVLTESYAVFDDSTQGIIQMGTVNYTKKKFINTSIIYGDFYYLEALGKLKDLPGYF